MPLFKYKGRNAKGELIKGEQSSASSNALAEQLNNMGVKPIEIYEVASNASAEKGIELSMQQLFQERIKHVDITLFTRQMHSLLKAGIPIMSALGGLKASTANKSMVTVIEDIYRGLDNGRELSVTLRAHPKVFSSFYVSMIRVGEDTGRLDAIFLKLYHHLEFEKFMRDQIKSALRYPTFVVIAMTAAIVVINIFVIPAFAKVFEGFDSELPLMTRILIGFSDFMVAYWGYMLLTAVALLFGFRYSIKTIRGRQIWDRYKLHIPIAGKIIKKAILARFAASFALASQSGVPIVQAINLIADTVDNAYIADKVRNMSIGIERGDSVHRTSINSGIFPPIVLQMIAVGEESGALESLMQEVSDMYQQDVEYELKTLGAQIEPIMIIFIGILVLILALGVFMPMWDLGQTAMSRS